MLFCFMGDGVKVISVSFVRVPAAATIAPKPFGNEDTMSSIAFLKGPLLLLVCPSNCTHGQIRHGNSSLGRDFLLPKTDP